MPRPLHLAIVAVTGFPAWCEARVVPRPYHLANVAGYQKLGLFVQMGYGVCVYKSIVCIYQNIPPICGRANPKIESTIAKVAQ